MPQSKRGGAFAISLLALALTACQSDRFNPAPMATAPQPLPAAPSGTITSGQLPPPGQATGANQFPAPPEQAGDTQMAALDPNSIAAAPDLTPGRVAGVWSVSVSGQSCRVATPQTKFGQGYRAGPLRCPAPMDGVRSWNVSGKQLSFYDENGQTLATLYASGDSRFDGQTTTGTAVSLSR